MRKRACPKALRATWHSAGYRSGSSVPIAGGYRAVRFDDPENIRRRPERADCDYQIGQLSISLRRIEMRLNKAIAGDAPDRELKIAKLSKLRGRTRDRIIALVDGREGTVAE